MCSLYIVLMAAFPPVLWLMLRKPDLVLLLSLALYLAARLFGWNLSARVIQRQFNFLAA